MARRFKVAVLVGSLARASINRKVARALIALAPDSLDCSFVEIGELPLYTPDLEADPPPAVRAFREKIAASEALLFVTPEYNRSVPGALKNALDVGSRPYGKSVWGGRPAAIVSATPGALGGFGANHHLRQSLVFLDVPTMQQPEAYVGGAANLFDQSGALVVDSTREFLAQFMSAFAAWVERVRRP